jgi:hypothetical protein
MHFAAEIVVKKQGNTYMAGFASKTSGRKITSYGKWFGSQMSWRPFNRAMDAALAEASRLNALSNAGQSNALTHE